jgi:hypothetical protein
VRVSNTVHRRAAHVETPCLERYVIAEVLYPSSDNAADATEILLDLERRSSSGRPALDTGQETLKFHCRQTWLHTLTTSISSSGKPYNFLMSGSISKRWQAGEPLENVAK